MYRKSKSITCDTKMDDVLELPLKGRLSGLAPP